MEMNGGYDVEVPDTISAKYECQICMLILRQPVQTLCGHRFCRSCLNSLYDQQGKDIICPVDREIVDMATLFHDKAYEREILDIPVKCSNHKAGCNWMGELRNLQGHAQNQCSREKIQCENENCNVKVFRCDLDVHTRNNCLYRTLNCNHCSVDYKYINEQDHVNQCAKYPIPCNNYCGVLQIPRNKMGKHLKVCPLTVVSCAYRNVGCTMQFPRKMEENHMKNHTQEHLHLTLYKTAELQSVCEVYQESISSLESQIHQLQKAFAEKDEEVKGLQTTVQQLSFRLETCEINSSTESSYTWWVSFQKIQQSMQFSDPFYTPVLPFCFQIGAFSRNRVLELFLYRCRGTNDKPNGQINTRIAGYSFEFRVVGVHGNEVSQEASFNDLDLDLDIDNGAFRSIGAGWDDFMSPVNWGTWLTNNYIHIYCKIKKHY